MIPFFSRRRREHDLDEEIRTHFRMAIQERVARGESRTEAERAVLREFGGVGRVKEATRDMWRGVWLDRLVQDLRFGARSLLRDPGFALVAILTLGLGVGVTTAMFTVVNGVLFRPLPFFEPDRLVAVGVQSPEQATGDLHVLDDHFLEIRRQSSSFALVTTYMSYPPTTLTGAGDAVRMRAAFVTADFLGVLGVRLALGSGFAPGDDQAGASPVVILGDALWRNRFGADPAVLGTTATLDGVPRTVVGVMPPGFDFPERADLWLPLEANPFLAEGRSYTNPVVARLGENITADQASAELSAMAATSEWRRGTSDAPLNARVIPLKDVVVGESRYPLLIFTGAVALVLLISCTNVANLLLMRADTREQEIGLRRMLGAGRPRMVRQLLTESVLLALLGGAVGILLAAVGVQALLALAPSATIPRGQELGIDLAVLAFTVAVSTVTGVGFGLAPAFKATGRELRDTIAEGSRTLTRRRGLARGALVVSEVGLAVVLLTGAGLLLRSFQQIRAIDLGFRPENTLTFYVDLPEYSYASLESVAALHRRVLDGLELIPGVEATGAANFEPFGPLNMSTPVYLEDGTEEHFGVGWMVASPGYFPAMGIPVLSGRGFTAQDDGSALKVTVISRSMADQLWPNGAPIGKRLSRNRNEWLTVVGVAEDVVRNDVTANRGPLMYLPLAQIGHISQVGHMSYVVRTAASRRAVAPAIRAVLRGADPNLPAGSISTMDEVVLASIGDRIFQTRILSVFAILALLLAAVGIYGVTAYSVSERAREIGIRIAVGARPEQVARMTLGRVMALVVPGLLLGSSAGLAATRLITASLYEIAPGDLVTFVGVALLLGGVSVAAALVPTTRAARVDPMTALRLE